MSYPKLKLDCEYGNHKILNYELHNGAIDATIYNNFMLNIKLNNKQQFFVDNARIHHAKTLNNSVKHNTIYNVPYYSVFNVTFFRDCGTGYDW